MPELGHPPIVRWLTPPNAAAMESAHLALSPPDDPAVLRLARIARCTFAEPLRRKGKVVRSCRDRYCTLGGGLRVVCRLSDCRACPVPAGRILEGPC